MKGYNTIISLINVWKKLKEDYEKLQQAYNLQSQSSENNNVKDKEKEKEYDDEDKEVKLILLMIHNTFIRIFRILTMVKSRIMI